ncbi:MAG: nucleotide exchange factor GrpE [Ignavibacteriae bacterium]|nr:nucleotide exchange factor GrpE [Ignavibacteriota bacterium]
MNKHEKHTEEKKEIKIKDRNDGQKPGTTAPQKDSMEIEKLKQELETYKDALLRKAAEFENYKRRTEGEISNYIKYASEHLIKQLIPVYDDLSRSIDSIEKGETNDFETLKKGVELIFNKFENVLKKEGLREMDVLGKEFDVNLCDALLQVPKEDVKPNTVVDVVEKGYFLKDKVVKHAKVMVSAEVPKAEENKEKEND